MKDLKQIEKKNSLKLSLLLLLLIVFIGLVFVARDKNNVKKLDYEIKPNDSLIYNNKPTLNLKVRNNILNVYVANNDADRQRGLSYTDSLASNEGMLFDFQTEGNYGFWMKDMNYDLDIIWLNRNMEIVYIEENVSKNSYPQIYRNQIPAQYVLELNAGTAKALGINRLNTKFEIVQ